MAASAAGILETRYLPIFAALVVGLTAWSWQRRFVMDDAFISFRYAEHLAAGQGLVWNTGERIEGYTNFLWTLILAIPLLFGADPVSFCFVVGPLLFAGTLTLAGLLALEVLGSKPLSLLAVALLGTNPTFSAFATGGLETQLLACLLTAAIWLVIRAGRRRDPGMRASLLLSLLAGAAIMTRLDASVVVVPAMALACVFAWKGAPARALAFRSVAALFGPVVLLVGLWLGWKSVYYGQVLPNTFFLREIGGGVWRSGLSYLAAFLGSYWLWPVAILLVAGVAGALARSPRGAAPLMLLLAAQLAYIVHVGGDFMEFRFLVPAMPILFVLIVWLGFQFLPHRALGAALIGLVVAGSVHHARTFSWRDGVEPVGQIASYLHRPDADWAGIGKTLGAALRTSTDVTIAVTAAGAIPYYSKLPTIDMLGLSDAWVARHGLEFPGPAGHRRMAPTSYLIRRGVHLVLGNPWVVPTATPAGGEYTYDDLRGRFVLPDASAETLPATASVLEIPLDARRAVVAVYLKPHPAVEAAIAAESWRRKVISARP